MTSADELSIVGQQRGDKFAPYQADAGDDILLVRARVGDRATSDTPRECH